MDDKIQKKIDELFILFSKNLPERIHTIEIQWQNQLKNWNFVSFQEFHRQVHSLCGSAGTYGYTALSHTARKMEILLRSILEKGSMTVAEQEKITNFLSLLKSVLAHEAPEKPGLFSGKEKDEENKLIYILESEFALVSELKNHLKQIGYDVQHIKNMAQLHRAVSERQPISIIINAAYLDAEGIALILRIKKEQQRPFQLFCIFSNADLVPRIAAIRAGAVAFYQKPLDIAHLIQELNINCNFTQNKAYRILILDDAKSLAEYYSLILKQADMVTHAITNPLDLLTELDKFQPDLLLMDVYMPDCTGLELAAILRKDKKYTKLPIIFLSTEDDKNKKLSAISLGGDEFLTKPVAPQDLVLAVKSRSYRAGILNYYMNTDSLTGLLNHSSLLSQLNIEMLKAKQGHLLLSFIMIDVDHFKLINDTYGHLFGDMVLKKLSSLLLINIGSNYSVGRYGGEEFAIILPGATLEKSQAICNTIRTQFTQYYFMIDNQKVFVTFSAGISTFDKNKKDMNHMIIQADHALYQAKQNGRDQVVVFNEF